MGDGGGSLVQTDSLLYTADTHLTGHFYCKFGLIGGGCVSMETQGCTTIDGYTLNSLADMSFCAVAR